MTSLYGYGTSALNSTVHATNYKYVLQDVSQEIGRSCLQFGQLALGERLNQLLRQFSWKLKRL